MPYILPSQRAALAALGEKAVPFTAGELNYLVSMRIKREYTEKGKSYGLFNDMIADINDAILALKVGVCLEPGFGGDVSDLALKFILQGTEMDAIATDKEIALRIRSACGALECAKLEFARRIVAPYEDAKIKENGDVY